MQERKTVGQLMEEMRIKAGAQNYHGHEYMDLQRFAEDTRHMIIFDVLTYDSPVGWKGERTRLFLTEAGYQKSLESQEKGHIKILSHAKVSQGHLHMLNQAGGDRQILAKQLGISPHQLSYVTHSGEGEGLLFYGATILPFVDHFPKNTELYRIMTTKPQELKKEDE